MKEGGRWRPILPCRKRPADTRRRAIGSLDQRELLELVEEPRDEVPVELCELPRNRISGPPVMQRRQRADHGGRPCDGQARGVVVKDQFLAVPVDDQVR